MSVLGVRQRCLDVLSTNEFEVQGFLCMCFCRCSSLAVCTTTIPGADSIAI